MKLFERIVKIAGGFRTTKTMNRKTGKVKTSIKRVKPKGVARQTRKRK